VRLFRTANFAWPAGNHYTASGVLAGPVTIGFCHPLRPTVQHIDRVQPERANGETVSIPRYCAPRLMLVAERPPDRAASRLVRRIAFEWSPAWIGNDLKRRNDGSKPEFHLKWIRELVTGNAAGSADVENRDWPHISSSHAEFRGSIALEATSEHRDYTSRWTPRTLGEGPWPACFRDWPG